MKKILAFLVVIVITTFFIYFNKDSYNKKDNEIRGIFISYLEYEKYLKGKNNNEMDNTIKNMIQNVDSYKFNTIYLQVRMFSDCVYNSKIFPISNTVISNNKIDIDILNTFIKYAKEKKIKIYAWINPYRISTSTDINSISIDNPAYVYLNTNHVKVVKDKGIYYNPASNVVKNLIISGVLEIVENYDINGIIFDDYFYPDDEIDLDNYKEYENTISIKDYHLSQVNDLVSRVYKIIKDVNSNMEFGISPDGNIDNNYNRCYADIKKWLSEDGYIDFIMPQIYYGFYNESRPFIKTVNEWNDLIKNNVKLVVALALYKSGSVDNYAKSGKDEWINNYDIISKEIKYSRNLSNYSGFSLYRYDYLIDYKNDIMHKEINNYLNLIK